MGDGARSKAAVVVCVVAGAAALGGVLLWMNSRASEATQGETKKTRYQCEDISQGKSSQKEVVKKILEELDEAVSEAQAAIESIKDETISVNTANSEELKVEKVKLIVQAMSPIQSAQNRFKDKYGFAQGELEHVIAQYCSDTEIASLNNSIAKKHADISKYTVTLMTG
mmetsp:Transcript_14717/g.23941  ORF Transcript_14717/g.23941 Transcript_14717/m.23941 type:complete len:169 (-) Transcript_14717:78-584(-)